MKNKFISTAIRNTFENNLNLIKKSLRLVTPIIKNTKKDHIINNNEKTQGNNNKEVAGPGRKENERAI